MSNPLPEPMKGINMYWLFQSIKYGPGHEKFPSWPVPAAAETSTRASSGGGSTRSKSWTDHTNYPKEKAIAYTRPHMKRQHSQYTQQVIKCFIFYSLGSIGKITLLINISIYRSWAEILLLSWRNYICLCVFSKDCTG